MKIIGMLRVRNEARWIADVLASIQPLCSEVVVFDDHSTDGTPRTCEKLGAIVMRSTFEDKTDETRDKNALLAEVKKRNPTYVLHIDGDEILAPCGAAAITHAIRENPHAGSFCFRVLYLWDSMNQVRTDGVYGRFTRGSLFRCNPHAQFRGTSHGGNFHCGNIPQNISGPMADSGAALLHLGYMHKEDRLRKYYWYNERDPRNSTEDCYRHIVQGDIPEVPASAELRWAGPLKLETLVIPEVAHAL